MVTGEIGVRNTAMNGPQSGLKNKTKVAIALLVLAALGIASAEPQIDPAAAQSIQWKAQSSVSEKLPFIVYREPNRERHFNPSGQIGDAGDLTLVDQCPRKAKDGEYCIRIDYSAKGSASLKWAGVYWLEPDFNFGSVPDTGYNLRAAARLTFWARGEKGSECISVKAGGVTGEFPDSFNLPLTNVKLTRFWKKYSIPLTGQDLTYVIGGFYVGFTQNENPSGATVYLDNIVYE